MKYEDYAEQKDLLHHLLRYTGIIRSEHFVIKINHFPDYDLSSYEGEIGKDYIFNNTWNFRDDMSYVLNFKFGDLRIYHSEDIRRMVADSGIEVDEKIEDFLDHITHADPELLTDYGLEGNEYDEFKIKVLMPQSIENAKRLLWYKGVFFGDSIYIDPIDFAVYTKLGITYVPALTELKFYEALIGESISISDGNQNNLAFFTLFSAFDSLVNTELKNLGHANKKPEDSIAKKFEILFTRRFGNIGNHEIYNSFKKKFLAFKDFRNSIAHGSKPIKISEGELKEMQLFVLTMLISFRDKLTMFNEVNIKIAYLQNRVIQTITPWGVF
ncbi:hypothetical protein IM793_22980 [Pedobacter sp. MR2016-19]|uniref:MAE_28990/MAE_18760 family HEPN-like nuclease n=1 Tax=Pedobacter sp. MR2016-19 TaxID=2780089 RepID=UPI0018739D57|nr:MAE_28990/MAE_18760 family HEPN-like nuclease [Pedobacter sp. MR2016-19]MBE5322038.1 hypothetical protein [Pedobacter sp. MR2016-19]